MIGFGAWALLSRVVNIKPTRVTVEHIVESFPRIELPSAIVGAPVPVVVNDSALVIVELTSSIVVISAVVVVSTGVMIAVSATAASGSPSSTASSTARSPASPLVIVISLVWIVSVGRGLVLVLLL